MRKRLLWVTIGWLSLAVHARAQHGLPASGLASFYADKFEGRPTASGEPYQGALLTAAHRTLPFGTFLKITNLTNGREVVVRVNDRGPFAGNRLIDLSMAAAKQLDFIRQGLVRVKIEPAEGPQAVAEITPVEKEYYAIHARKIRPGGFGIQVGSFREAANMAKLAAQLESTYQLPVTVEVAEVNALRVYRVMAGQFTTRKEAEQWLQKMAAYPDAFIVEF